MRNKRRDKHSTLEVIVVYTLVLAVLEGVVYSQFIAKGVTLVWNADALGQYYPAFLYIGQYWRTFLSNLLSGTFALPAFDLSIGMGEDVVGALNYYGFGDPINILALFATKDNGTVVYAISYYLRLWLGGLAFLYYCHRMGLQRWPAVLGTLAYVMSGWTIVGGLRYIAWGSALVYTPLMMAGAEEIIRKTGRYLLFVISVVYGALCGFYFLYMSSLALGVYCLIRIGCTYGGRRRDGIYVIARLLGLYVMAIIIASPVFYPAVRAFFNSARSASSGGAITNWELYRPSLQRIRDFLMLSIKPGDFNYMLGVLPVEYIAIGFYLIRSRQARRRQIAVASVAAIIAIALPISDWLFNGFAESNLRWVYILHLLAAVAFATALSDENILPNIIYESSKVRMAAGAVLWGIALANMLYNGWMIYDEQGAGWISEFCTPEQVADYVNTPTNDAGLSENGEPYRIANDTFREITGRPENLGMINGYNGLTYWFSIINGSTQYYVNHIYGSALEYRSFGLNHGIYTEAMAGCQYYISSEDLSDTDYILDHTFQDVGGQTWYLYRNPYYVGMAYCISNSNAGRGYEDATEETNADLYTMVASDAVTSMNYDRDHDRCSVQVDCSDASRLVLAFPYSSEWQVYVDGTRASVDMFGMYLSVNVEAGSHTVVFRYTSIVRQICCIASLLVIMVILYDYGRRHGMRLNSPNNSTE